MDTGFVAITLLAFGFVGWYGAGSLYNRFVSKKLMRKIGESLKKYRVSKELTTLGSSGFIVNMDKPMEKIRKLSISVVLSKREMPINWIVDYVRGKRDTITIKAVLASKPRYDVDVFRIDNYYGKILSRKLDMDKAAILDGVYVYPVEARGKGKVENILRIMRRSRGIWWVSVKREGLHVMITSDSSTADNMRDLLRLLEDLA